MCVEIDDLVFRYEEAGFALRVPHLAIPEGKNVALVGPSGSGKTSLLHLIAGILVPQQGRIRVEGEDVTRMRDAQRRRFRISTIGIIFQEFELLEHLTVRENVLLPYYVNRALTPDAAVEARLHELADTLGIGTLLARKPRRLSHGERQRVAVCRALVTEPPLLLGDEPTGNLDPKNTRTLLDLVFEEARRREATFLMVTHDHGLLDAFDEVLDAQTFVRGDTA